jgi:hypothetical protein
MNETKYRTKMRFYHPSAKGNGCALSLQLLPAEGVEEGCIMATLAKQATIGNRQGATPVYPTFNWEDAITVKLGFGDLCKMLQVLRGEHESIEEGKGLYHRSAGGCTKITLRHLLEPVSGYAFEVHRLSEAPEGENRMAILLSSWEALGLSEAIAGSMSAICFGVPKDRPVAVKKASQSNEAA